MQQNRIADCVVWLCFVVSVIFMGIFHEPWFDEAQAWLIARDDSLWHLITVTSHYEGHPPLWHLLLMPFAKIGIPFEIGIKLVSLMCSAIGVGFLIFFSPFPTYVRYSLPFTYFVFYQYTVVCRTYALMFAALMGAAAFYHFRNEKPLIYVFFLITLAGTSVYGLLFACGMALYWCGEILQESNMMISCKMIFDKRIRALTALLLFGTFWGLCVLPFSDTYAMVMTKRPPFMEALVYMLFMWPLQATFISLGSNMILDYSTFLEGVATTILLFVGCLFQLLLYYIGKKTHQYFLYAFPMFLVSLIGAKFYFSQHHTGILYLYLVFCAWMCAEKMRNNSQGKVLFSKELKMIICSLVGLVIIIPIYWTIKACYTDYCYNYDIGRSIVHDIKEMELDNKIIWGNPEFCESKNTGESAVLVGPLVVNAYFDKPVIANANLGVKKGYNIHRVIHKKDFWQYMQAVPKPDAIITLFLPKDSAYQTLINFNDYVLKKDYHVRKPYKDQISAEYRAFLYVKKQ